MRTTLAIAVLAGFAAAPALAADPIMPAPFVPSPISPVSAHDWGGFYAGATLGYGWASSNAPVPDQNAFGAALHAGYNLDMGDWVVGLRGEYAPAALTDLSVGGRTLDHAGRLTAIAGMKLGPRGETLGYFLGGAGVARSSAGGADFTDWGWTVGAGVSQALGEAISVSGEVTYARFDDVGGTSYDVDGVGVSLGLSYHF